MIEIVTKCIYFSFLKFLWLITLHGWISVESEGQRKVVCVQGGEIGQHELVCCSRGMKVLSYIMKNYKYNGYSLLWFKLFTFHQYSIDAPYRGGVDKFPVSRWEGTGQNNLALCSRKMKVLTQLLIFIFITFLHGSIIGGVLVLCWKIWGEGRGEGAEWYFPFWILPFYFFSTRKASMVASFYPVPHCS